MPVLSITPHILALAGSAPASYPEANAEDDAGQLQRHPAHYVENLAAMQNYRELTERRSFINIYVKEVAGKVTRLTLYMLSLY